MRPCRLILLLFLWACTTLPEHALAFVYGGAARCCDTIYFRVEADPLLPDPLLQCGDAQPAGWFRGLIDQAAGQWNAEGTVFQLIDAGPTQTSCVPSPSTGLCMNVKDDQNTVSLGNTCAFDANVLAFSTRWFFTAGPDAGCVVEADICFNASRLWYTNAGSCAGSCFDVVSVALHEFGHWISSNHENDVATLGYAPVMYQSTSPCLQRRVPSADDRALLHWAASPNGVIRVQDRQSIVHLHPADASYNTPPPHESCGFCDCPCHGNPRCEDENVDIFDVILTIDAAFRDGPASSDPICPLVRSDVDCSGAVDILDVTRMVNVAFRAGNIATEFCDPCN